MSDLSINTTQGVKLFFTTASIGERILAYLVDGIIKVAYIFIALTLYFRVFSMVDITLFHDEVAIALIFVLMMPAAFYTLVCENLMDGRTFGKKLLKIKVVKIDGFQAGFFDYFIRWIFYLVDVQMGFIPGIISMVVTRHTQRLGDLAAGTAVISERSKYNISHTILMNISEEYVPYFSQNQVLLFSDNDIRIVKENAETAQRMGKYVILNHIARKIENVMKITNPLKNDRELIEVLLKDYNYYTGK